MRNSKDLDLRFPRAPSREAWARLNDAQRAEVVASLPDEVTDAEMSPPEGDAHFHAKVGALDVLRGFFTRQRRSVYLASELPVYYPGERRFAPDLLAVLDVPTHLRGKWVVTAEGKGLDLVVEVHVGGDRRKDAERNVAWYAHLGITEYFILDVARRQILGYRLPNPTAQVYAPIAPEEGRLQSSVLGLELQVEKARLCFYRGNALLLETTELLSRAQERINEEVQLREEEARLRQEEARLRQEEARLRQEEARLRQEAESRVAALEAELAALKNKES